MSAILKPRITTWQSISSAHASYVPLDFFIGLRLPLTACKTANTGENFIKSITMLAASLCLLPAVSPAQTYPVRPVKIVVPYAPGGGIDVIARAISERLTPKWGQPIVVENKTGGATIIGADSVAKAAPDGHTLLLTSESTITSNPFLFDKLPYDTTRDLAPVTQLVSLPQMVVAHSSVAASSLKELLDQARVKPNALNYASYGSGSLPHLFFEGLKSQGGVQITQVPYKGIAPALLAIVSGEVQLTLVGVALSQGHIQSGKIKPLAIARRERLAALPQVPTLREAGYAEVDPNESWFGLFITGGSPASLAPRIQRDIAEAFSDPAFRERYVLSRGFDPVFSTPEDFARFIQADMVQKARLIKISGAKAE